MYKLILFTIFISCTSAFAQDLITPYEKSNGTETATYEEGIKYYKQLANTFSEINMKTMGKTDSGEPLHLVVFNMDEDFSFEAIQNSNKHVFFINNGIHPGESDGIDASMMLLRNLAQNAPQYPFLEDVIIAVIPFYNIGGALNRNSTTRTNQNGPKSYGFRGNAQNYDLNRDFIKMDSKNAFAFAEIFHSLDPTIFVDTHVTNGSDHQHVVTVLTTQHDKLGGSLGSYLEDEFEPLVFEKMYKKGRNPIEYVNVHGSSPEEGWNQFWDSPRYSTGYTALFQTIGFMTEDHMWKPFKTRVEHVYDFLMSAASLTASEGDTIDSLKYRDRKNFQKADSLPVFWKNNKEEFKMITLEGYNTSYPESELTGNALLKYDRSSTFEKDVPFYNSYFVTKKAAVPDYYIIPQAWYEVVERMKANQVKMIELKKDTSFAVNGYEILDFETSPKPFEGHYLHFNTSVNHISAKKDFRKGDLLIPTDQYQIRYIVESLEPEAKDSFFNWNFFDSILQQKEGFSDYVFEPMAQEILNSLSEKEQSEFLNKKETDTTFAKSNYAQLDWIFKRSDHYEKAHMQYPVYKLFLK